MPIYDIRISGYAANVEADSPEAAIKQIKEFSHVYCTFTALDSKTYEPVPLTVDGEWTKANETQADSRMERK